MRLAFGEIEAAQTDASLALDHARLSKEPQIVLPALAFGARAFCTTDPRRADELVRECLAEWRSTAWRMPTEWLVDLGAALVVVNRLDELLETAEGASIRTPWLEAAIAMGGRGFERAAEIYGEVGHRPAEAYALLRAAELLVGDGRRAEADAALQQALAFWRSVGATAYVREGEALLAASA